MKIFITGGSRGIGNNLVRAALAQGHEVAFTYVDPGTDVDRLHREMAPGAPEAKVRGYRLDVREPAQVAEVVERVIDDFGTIDAVVNNAGINQDNLAVSMSDQQWRAVIDTNLSGPFYVIRQFLPLFLSNRKGRFISISSVAGSGSSGQANYSASKAGLVGLSASIAMEYGVKGITSNVVIAGMFDTDMTRETLNPRLRRFWMDLCPLRRMGGLQELSEVILFLASDQASFVTGQVIHVTGGLNWSA
jgi:NAD(P)-dependent dehydrogenase (short-subunit alcohol dehydrogenase family)